MMISNGCLHEFPQVKLLNAHFWTRIPHGQGPKPKNMDLPANHLRLWPYLSESIYIQRPKPICIIKTCPTDESHGFTMWHLLALGLLQYTDVEMFLRSTLEVKSGIVFDDLFERITKPIGLTWSPHQLLSESLVGYGIEELCRIQELSLLGHYLHEGVLGVPMSPAVVLFERWIDRELTRSQTNL